MIKGKNIVGFCTTTFSIDSEIKYLEKLYEEIRKTNNKLIVFNSTRNISEDDSSEKGAFGVFDAISYEKLDALIIFRDAFQSEEVVERIVEKAKQNNVPVFMIHGKHKDCYSIYSRSLSTFETLIKHVIKDHKADDLFFINGVPEKKEAQDRLGVFKKALEDCNIQFDESKTAYGGFESEKASSVVADIIKEKRVPKAFICANDDMAIGTIQTLKANGYRVPEDVIVTGYDGIEITNYFEPKISTCAENIDSLVDITIKLLDEIKDPDSKPRAIIDDYSAVLTESCGCFRKDEYIKDRLLNAKMFEQIYTTRKHESDLFNWINHAATLSDIGNLREELQEHIVNKSALCLNPDFEHLFTDSLSYSDSYPETMQVYVACDRNYKPIDISEFSTKDMVPDFDSWVLDEDMYVLNSVYVGSMALGYYAVKTSKPNRKIGMINRLAAIINMAFSGIYNKITTKSLSYNLETARTTNPISGFMNMIGLQKWFDDFSIEEVNHQRALSVEIYNIGKYRYILENYGVSEIREVVSFLANELRNVASSKNTVIAQVSDEDCVILYFSEPKEGQEAVEKLQREVNDAFGSVINEYNAKNKKPYTLEIRTGSCRLAPGWEDKLNTMIKLANGDMYLNRLREESAKKEEANGSIENKDTKTDKNLQNRFDLLLEKNLFNYFFQPLVDAHTGEIYAYEALMRTTKEVNLFPLEILDLAEKNNKLYNIEYATFFNVFERLQHDFEKFKGRKVFINTIPGHFLKDKDLNTLTKKYSDYMKYSVIELTEGESLKDEEIEIMRGLSSDEIGSMIAVDDYGTGHSNIVNVLRYLPQVIKVDRYLITDIHTDRNKQLFVKNAIEFAKANKIKVVAEGVETRDELNMVIMLGVDLIQGYYTAKPAPEPIDAINEEIKLQIIDAYQNR